MNILHLIKLTTVNGKSVTVNVKNIISIEQSDTMTFIYTNCPDCSCLMVENSYDDILKVLQAHCGTNIVEVLWTGFE